MSNSQFSGNQVFNCGCGGTSTLNSSTKATAVGGGSIAILNNGDLPAYPLVTHRCLRESPVDTTAVPLMFTDSGLAHNSRKHHFLVQCNQ